VNAGVEYVSIADASDDELAAALWRAGKLDWKLGRHTDQLSVYEQYRAWEAKTPATDDAGELARVFVLDIARRWGKTTLCLVWKLEDCIRQPGSTHTYGCAYAKDIADIVVPLMEELIADAPADVRPVFRRSQEGESVGYYFPDAGPARGARLKLVGIDRNPHGLRGRRSDGCVLSEAGYVRHLERVVRDVLYPQMQGRQGARIVLESSAPSDPVTDFDRIFVPDARARGAYVERTIDDNPLLSEAERQEFIRAAGGRGAPTCEREYYGVRVREVGRVVVPEFDRARHVQAVERPKYAHCYVAIDPGMRDLCAVLWAYWDFERAQLVIESDWAERNANTTRVADEIKRREERLWSECQYWTGKDMRANPYIRVSDTDLRLIGDLITEHGLKVIPARKDDKEAALHSLRNAFGADKIVLLPSCERTAEHLEACAWNENRTDYERSELFGHFDLVDALVYLWRHVQRGLNPNPPSVDVKALNVFVRPDAPRLATRTVAAFNGAFGARRRWAR
jgi:hypothetical protein